MEQYLNNMKYTLHNGVRNVDRTGVGTLSVFGQDERYDLKDGKLPIVTTKKIYLKAVIHELIWMISGDTNIRYLKENGVRIWDEWVKPETAVYQDLTLDELTAAIIQRFASSGATSIKDVVLYGRISDNPFDFKVEEGALAFSIDGDIIINYDTPLTNITCRQDEDGNYHILDTDATLRHPPLYYGLIAVAHCYGVETKRLVAGELGPVYGKCWRAIEDIQHTPIETARLFVGFSKADHLGTFTDAGGNVHNVWKRTVDQLANVLDSLKNNPHSRRHIVNAWHVPFLDEQALPPCHTLFQFYVKDVLVDGVTKQYLSCKLTQRSADIFLGKPFNIAFYSILTHAIANQLGMEADEFIWSGGDCHLYLNHLEQVDLQLSREPLSLPSIRFSKPGLSILDMTYDDIEVIGYESHPAIPAPVAV